MAHQRSISTLEGVKEKHSISLKHPLPTPSPSPTAKYASPAASLAYPSTNAEENFILSPVLTLPPAFGSAYVGETFSCTLCANNELLPGSDPSKTISNVRIEAEMKIPSSGEPIALELGPAATTEREDGETLGPESSLQKVVNFDLKEEGSHVLAVTVTYSETTPTSGRVRTFRKLYQFVCKGCMVVRTKSGVLPSASKDGNGEDLRRWALEAQLENSGEETITLDTVDLSTKDGFRGMGMNWIEAGDPERPVLNPGDIQQVCFVVEETVRSPDPQDGRLIFGVLKIGWRGNMGNRGFLNTGNLGARLR
ncbi:DUF974 domain-containing protein [Phlyctema vagabunda]|uniref:DUF974 domain-containing protein n=1 Tax=Phlyctema vagabunda TaxID=108571 RepID=A0ABR4PWZ0_9HELO